MNSGYHIITVIDDNSCTLRDTIFIAIPQSPLQVTTSSKATICHQDSLGELTAIGAGGTPPYTYEMYGPTGFIASSSGNLGTSFLTNPLVSGTYTLIIIDAN